MEMSGETSNSSCAAAINGSCRGGRKKAGKARAENRSLDGVPTECLKEKRRLILPQKRLHGRHDNGLSPHGAAGTAHVTSITDECACMEERKGWTIGNATVE